MPTSYSIRISLVNAQGQPLGGTVDFEFVPLSVPTGPPITIRGVDASKDVDIGVLQRVPVGQYRLTIRPTDGTFQPVSQTVTISDSGTAPIRIVIQKQDPGIAVPRNSLKGTLAFDNGLPAGGITTRAYHVGFGGQEVKLGEVVSDAGGAYLIQYAPPAPPVNLQVRVVDSKGAEVTISATKYGANTSETLNLVVPASVKPLASEFVRLSADLAKSIGDITRLGQAQESGDRQDLTLLRRSTNWDARLVALAATAVQQAAITGVGQEVLYGLYRVGLPSDPALLATVPSSTVQEALKKASEAGIVQLDERQIAAAVTAVQNCASKTLLASVASGAVSTFQDLLSPMFKDNPTQQAAFAGLFFSQASTDGDFWAKAAALNIPAATIDSLRLQGKFLYLTSNNAPLAQRLQQTIGTAANLDRLVGQDFHKPETWQATLVSLAGTGGDKALNALIPSFYSGTPAERAAAYAGDLARKVRMSFPGQVAARMIETRELAVDQASAPAVTSFLRKAAPLGYGLGRTPLNRFLKSSGGNLPALNQAATRQVKTLHRLYQITPSMESLQSAMQLGFTSAYDIAKYPQEEFLAKYESAFPAREALIVYRQARTVSSVTFNAFAAAKAMENAPPVYGFSATSADLQRAKDSLVQQFPSMATLFGNLDFCQCQDCRSVLSPAAYFVDVLDLLGEQSAPNPAGYTPLDVLIGKDAAVPGRRPDLGALPLTCENTNSAMPYIDLVNEIFEYYIANSTLDAGAAYDTGSAATADLIAEPQHILPNVYSTTLKQAVYPLNLPFDLWIETVRGFLSYFKIPFEKLLDAFRQANTLELFAGPPATPYFRSQILAESLAISPTEYAVFTSSGPANWFHLYGGYANEAAAINDLKSAKTLSQRLGVSYQELTDLVQTGFLNPGLYPLIFQFERFNIDIADAFGFTNQPGFPALTAQQAAVFGAKLDKITASYLQQNASSTFNARTWLGTILPANYSRKVLMLADPNSGCDFSATTLQYADGSPVTPLDLMKFNLFVRLWKKLGWTLEEVDLALQAFFPSNVPVWTDPGFAAAFGAAWKTALVYLAHLEDLNTRLAPDLGRTALLPFWTNLPAQGPDPLFSRLFLTAGVLNNDPALDDPNGNFPCPASDLSPELRPLSAHAAAVQGVLGLTAAEITAILADAAVASPAAFSMANLSICYRYSLLAKCLDIPVADLVALRVMSGLHPFQALSGTSITAQAGDVLSNQTIEFVKQVSAVEESGFTVEDLKYLLRHQFDPVGKYQSDPNALILLIQSAAAGLAQIRTQNAVPVDLMSQAESLIDQRLSGLVPAAILKTLFGHLTNSQTYTASQGGVAAAIDPTPFSQETSLAFQYDAVTQTQSVSFKGLLADWKKTRLEAINATPLFAGLLDAVQKQAHDALAASINDILGVWASLVQYEAVETPVAPAAAISDPLQKLSADPALTFSYDQSDQLQWLGYRGVLTDQKLNVLTTLNNSATLAGLLAKVQQQALPAYNEMTGSMLAMWTNGQSYVATASPVTPAGQVDTAVFTAALAQAQQNGTIVDPVPPIQFAYDSAAQVQTLTCQGDLTDSMRAQLSALIPSAVLSNLLQTVRNQAVQLFQSLAAGLLTVGAADLDNYSKPFLAVDAARQQRLAKAGLVKVFSPLLARKLSRQFVLQTLSASLASDPSLTEALVTDAALLDDPSKPGQSLLNAFLAVGQPGVSATYYGSPDQSGAAIASGTAATTDTSDPSNSAAGMRSCRFEGYLQVPIDGPYRFFAELGNTNAQVAFRLDSPDPASLLPNPVIQQIAARDGDEASRFLQLKGGVAYHFTLDFKTLGAGGSSLLIQGENLPKGPLSQIQLYAQAAVDGFSRARILLAKVLQILEGTGIGERELSYLVANSSQFSNLRLSSLPTRASDDSAANAVALFAQFRTLTDYADLRKGPAGGTDGLIDVFQAASRSSPPAPASAVLANLTRRDAATVADVATALGPEPLFANNVGVRRVWDALQLVQILGLPVTAVSAATAIVNAAPANPDLIAANFKNAVKAQYTPGQWRPIAKSVFDVLRRRKRDALVSYLVNLLGLQNSNQLFEYFLIDPGMEPVVQTSRLRLAMSSLQTFVQRCLLNLENGNTAHPARNVAPSAIRADWWDWMKRYRVWQANREIFLFPENWMEPELRLDKTDLFQALESDLLQGDVTRDLVEDSFLTYLKGLDVRARLDIVATFLEQDLVNPGLSTLHVLGRTYGHPHKYFYRTCEDGTWSGWEAVTLDIEGDHVALAVWRGRLNVFWLTFVTKTQAPPSPGAKGGGAVSSLDFGTLTTDIFTATPQKLIQVQLHWSEHLQGKWTNRISSDVEKSELIAVHDNFDPRSVHVHVSKEVDSQGNEGAVRIHLDFPDVYEREYLQAIKFAVSQVMIARKFSPETASVDLAALASIQRANHAFRVTSKNCNPDFRSDYWQPPQSHPYNTTGVDATFYTGSSNLVASFQSQIQSDGSSSTEHESILNSTNHYQILTCANTVVPPFLDPSDPLLSDAGGLVAPVFFKDASNPSAGAASPFRDERTFYVQPSLTETVIEQWDGWAVSLVPAEFLAGPGILKQINVVAQVPESPIPVDPGDPVYSLNSIRNVVDWATDPATAITYGNVLVGKAGGIGTAEANVAAAAGTAATPGISVIGREGLGLRQLQSIQRSLRETLGIPLVRGNR
jgi:hypothetical protein